MTADLDTPPQVQTQNVTKQQHLENKDKTKIADKIRTRNWKKYDRNNSVEMATSFWKKNKTKQNKTKQKQERREEVTINKSNTAARFTKFYNLSFYGTVG